MKTLLLILLVSTLFATATLTKTRTFSQSDGTTFKGRLQGDAFLHWIEAEDGAILLFNKKTANFEYAKIEDGDIVLSGEVYRASKIRTLHVSEKNSLNKNSLKQLWEQRHQ
jgi:hypothetical protein